MTETLARRTGKPIDEPIERNDSLIGIVNLTGSIAQRSGIRD